MARPEIDVDCVAKGFGVSCLVEQGDRGDAAREKVEIQDEDEDEDEGEAEVETYKMPKRAKRHPIESTTIAFPRSVNWYTIVPSKSKWTRLQT